MENKYKRLAKNSIWSLLGNTGSKVLGFLLLPLYTRWLGTAGFGESDLVTTYSSFLVCIMTMCVADGIFAFTKNESVEVKRSFYSSSLIFILFALGAWLLVWAALNTAFLYYNIHNSFADNLWLIFGIVATTFWQQYSQQFILSLEKIRIYSFTGIIHSILTLLFSYWLIPVQGVKGYIMAMIYANLLTGVYSFLFSKSYFFLRVGSFSREDVVSLLKYSIPLIPNTMMWWLVSALNRPVMEYHLDFSAIGIYAVANRFPSVITMVFSVVAVAWNISVFEEYGKEGYEEFYKKTFRMLFLTIVIVASFVIASSELVISLFAAPEFIDAWKYMIILIIGAVFSCMSGFFGTNFGVVKKSKYFFYSSVWGAVTSIIFNFLLIPVFGLWGTVFSVLLSHLVMMMSRFAYSKKFVKASIKGEIAKYAFTMVIVATLTYYISLLWVKIIAVMLVLSSLIFIERDIVKPIMQGMKARFLYRKPNNNI